MEMHWPDASNKRDMIVENLKVTDYIAVQSQRRLWVRVAHPGHVPDDDGVLQGFV